MNTVLANELDEHLDKQIDAEQQGFSINNTDKADWALRKIEQYQGKINDANELKLKRTQQINDWCVDVVAENQKQIEYFESLLLPYAADQLANSKKRSFTLPSGTVGFRKSADKFSIDGEPVKGDSEKLVTMVESANPEFIKIKKVVDWIKFKGTLTTCNGKAVTADGEVLEDIKVVTGEDVFYTKGVKT